MPKVVHLSSVHRAFDPRILHKECKTLSRSGYDVVFVVPHDRNELVDGVQVRSVPRPRGRLWRMLVTTVQILRRALRENADLYHLHDPELLPVGRVLKVTGRRVVYDMHENVPKALLDKHWIPRSLRGMAARVYATLERVLMRGMPVVFAEQSYHNEYPHVRDSVVVQNMALTHVGTRPESAKYETPTMVYIGAISERRGASVLLEVLATLQEQDLQVHLEFVGPISPPNYVEDLTQLMMRRHVRGVQMHGPVDHSAALGIVSRCHVGLALLQRYPNYVDSYPTKMFEYMAAGIPVVVSDFPLYRSVVEEAGCGICVDPEDVGGVVAAIRWLVENPPEAQAMGRRGHQAVLEHYNWDNESRGLTRLYEKILATT